MNPWLLLCLGTNAVLLFACEPISPSIPHSIQPCYPTIGKAWVAMEATKGRPPFRINNPAAVSYHSSDFSE